MANSIVNKKRSIIYQRILNQDGFTLVEILVAMVILLLIVFAFTPLLTGSLERIYHAGYRSQAIVEAQAEVESRTADGDTVDFFPLDFDFNGESVDVPGGLIEIEKTGNNATAQLTSVVPLVPSITLLRSQLYEGYEGLEMDIIGYNTRFKSGDSSISAEGNDGTIHDFYITSFNVTDEENASIYLHTGLVNANSPYIFTITTPTESGDEQVRTRLQVDLPIFVAVGKGGSLLVSPDGEYWSNVKSGVIPAGSDIPVSNNLNSLIWSRARYVVVGDNQLIISLRNRTPWKEVYSKTSKALHCVNYGSNRFVAAGKSGLILYSDHGDTWNQGIVPEAASSFVLNGVVYGNEKHVAVGQSEIGTGAVLTSEDGQEWMIPEIEDTLQPLNDIIFIQNTYIAVGDNGAIYVSTDAISWINIVHNLTSERLNGITAGMDYLVAVGNSGTILVSSDAENWNSLSSGTSSDLHSITIGELLGSLVDSEVAVAVGNSGAIVSAEVPAPGNNWNWQVQSVPVSADLHDVTYRYDPELQ